MKIVIKIISYIFIFILMLAILTTVLLELSKATILNKEYMLAKIEKNSFYEKVHQKFIEQVEDYIEQSGLEEFDIQNTIKIEQVKKDVNEFFSKIYDGETITQDNEEIMQILQDRLTEMEQNGTKLSPVEKKSVEKVFEYVAETYRVETTYGTFSKYIEQVPKYVNLVNQKLQTVRIIIYVSVAVLSVLILLINIKHYKKGIGYIGTAILSSGTFLIGLNIFLKSNTKITNLSILNEATSDLIIDVFIDILSKITIIGIIGIAIAIILIAIGAIDEENANNRKKERHKHSTV